MRKAISRKHGGSILKAEIRPCRHNHGQAHLSAFKDGFARHGGQVVEGRGDFVVMWGHKDRGVIEGDRPYLVLEQGYLGDRLKWTSMGWNGLNGRATFPCGDATRWERYFSHLMRPWSSGAGVALLVGQVPGDAALGDLDLTRWLRDTAAALKTRGWQVIFRPHPNAPDVPCPNGAEMSPGLLADDLSRATLCVTYNSNTGVDAMLAGVPTVAMDEGSMAWPVAMHDIPESVLHRPDRTAWAQRLAWCQWTVEEIAAGDVWGHLKQCL